MRFLKYLLPFVLALSFSSAIYAQEHDRYEENLNERDFHVLRDYVYTKRTINLEEKDWNLAISGDIRTEWRHLNEKHNGQVLRGSQHRRRSGACDEAAIRRIRSRNDFDIEFNLRFDYVCDRSWGVAQLEFDNSAGVDSEDYTCCEDSEGWFGSGRCNDICLKKAYMGYNVCCACDTRVDVELGRRRLYDVFDSEVQFLSRFDGLLLRYSTSLECISDFYWNLAGFVVDERVNQFAYVTELGMLNIYDYGFDFKYSFIDWTKNGRSICGNNDPKAFQFRISQWTAYYHLVPECIGAPVEFYAAFLINHSAKKLNVEVKDKNGAVTGVLSQGKQDIAWYVGVTIGEVVREGDWALDVQYQWVEAQAVPDEDASGIGNGNTFNNTFTLNQEGNTNFKGWRIEALYAITDNLTLDTIIEHSVKKDSQIGGRNHYSKFELEAIYAF